LGKNSQNLLGKITDKPIFSSLCAAFGSVASLGLYNGSDYAGIVLPTFEASAFASIALVGISMAAYTRQATTPLSKRFSALATLSGMAGLTALTLFTARGDLAAMTASTYTTYGMAAAGLFNVAAWAARVSQAPKKPRPATIKTNQDRYFPR
jgi:hypothetical protein